MVLGRIVRSADFERVLALPACARSAHFAVHFLDAEPSRWRPKVVTVQASSTQLSTGAATTSKQPVDDSASKGRSAVWLGAVVPKRFARRAVTRNLLKRQIRAAARHAGGFAAAPLPGGLWVVRLRAAFERTEFVSAASRVLLHAGRGELDAVFAQASRKLSSRAPQVPRAGS